MKKGYVITSMRLSDCIFFKKKTLAGHFLFFVFLVQAVTELSVFFVSTLNAIKKQEEIEKKMNLEPKTHTISVQ